MNGNYKFLGLLSFDGRNTSHKRVTVNSLRSYSNTLEVGQRQTHIGNLRESAKEIAMVDKMYRMETDLQAQLSHFT